MAKPSWGAGVFVGFVSYLLGTKLASPLLHCGLGEQGGTSQQQQEKTKKELTHYSGKSDISTEHSQERQNP